MVETYHNPGNGFTRSLHQVLLFGIVGEQPFFPFTVAVIDTEVTSILETLIEKKRVLAEPFQIFGTEIPFFAN